jgi:hypothetical protein
VRVTASGDTVTLAAHLGEVVVALTVPVEKPGSGSLTLPMSVLESCEGSGPDGVALEPAGRSGGRARWTDRGLPRSEEFERPDPPRPWPPEPELLTPAPPALLAALHEAGRSASREAGKFTLDRIQVRGKAGEVNGTDGKQALVQGGFVFPFTQDLLLPAVPVFGAKELACAGEVSVGLAGDWLCVAAGPWRVYLLPDREARFPDVRQAVPRARGTTLTLSNEDTEVLVGDLQAWPREFHDSTGPVTLDLSEQACVRARISQKGEVVERRLEAASVAGPPVQMVLSRDLLGRALTLGFRSLRCASPERPLVAEDEQRVYLMVTMPPTEALPASKENIPAPPVTGRSRAASAAGAASKPEAPAEAPAAAAAALPVSIPPSPDPLPRRTEMPSREPNPATHNGHAETAAESADLLAEAEAVRTLLAEAAGRLARLVGALKNYRRERRSLQAAFSSLRQLNLG